MENNKLSNNTNDTVNNSFNATNDTINNNFNVASDTVNNNFNAASDTVNNSFNATNDTINNNFNAASDAVNNSFNAASDTVNNNFNVASDTVNNNFNAARDAVNNNFNAASDAVNNSFNAASDAVNNSSNNLYEQQNSEAKHDEVETPVTFSATYSFANSDKGRNTTSKQTYSSIQQPSTKKKGKLGKFFGFVAAMLIVSLIGGSIGSVMTAKYYKQNMPENQSTLNINSEKKDNTINLSADVFFAAAVNEKAKRSVVGITTTGIQRVQTFWGRSEQEVQIIGSGVVVTSDGYILTNSHVIGDGNATSVTVSLIDKTTEKAEVLWYDSSLDLAIIKINKTGLQAAELGDSDSVLVGEPVVAIGNPMSLELNGTVTDGIISGLNRSITIEGVTIKPLLQTNASINPGNSGGPLFNAEGQVIGINTAKMSSAEGLGFSIPINTALPMLMQITKGGEVNTVYIGATVMSVEDYKTRIGIELNIESGVYIVEILKNSPADKADLRLGDVIISVDDNEIENMEDLKRLLYKYKDGDTVKAKILRNGSEKIIEITLKAKPSSSN